MQDLFACAAALPPSARAGFLESACGEDAALRLEVEALLDEAGQPGGLLTLADEVPEVGAELVGTRIGRYGIIRLVGRGATGIVYEALRLDHPGTPTVALKVLRAGAVEGAARERFTAEQEALSRLHQAAIPAFLGVGVTADRRPFLVMEYVEGEPLVLYCQRRALDLDARLALFTRVCAAVHAANEAGVLHRDLKPANILVTPDGAIRLVDFGLATLLGSASETGADPRTRGGGWGCTPEYASPEAIRGSGVGAPAEVYSLGIVLFELVAGRRPFRFRDQTQAGIERIIREVPPPPLSRVVSLPRDRARPLEAVVGRALEKDPDLRYPDVAALGADVERVRQRVPVRARHGVALAGVRRVLGRRPWAVIAPLVAGALLVGLAVGRSWPRPGTAATTAAATERRAEEEATVGLGFLGAGQLDEAERHLEASVALRRALYGDVSAGVATGLDQLGTIALSRGDRARAEQLFREADSVRHSVATRALARPALRPGAGVVPAGPPRP